MKTDLRKILSVSGEPGLFLYISQANNGAILESLNTKKRNMFGLRAKMTSMADISIFTENDEVRLKQVFENMHKELGDSEAPSPKADSKEIVSFFEKVLPDYDREKFYVSHMKKVLSWYNDLHKNASLDFVNEDEENNAEGENNAKE